MSDPLRVKTGTAIVKEPYRVQAGKKIAYLGDDDDNDFLDTNDSIATALESTKEADDDTAEIRKEAAAVAAAAAHEMLTDEAHSLSSVLQMSFTWRKPLSDADIVAAKAKAAKSGKPYVADIVPPAPLPVSFSVEALNRAFRDQVNFENPQHPLSMYIESAYSTAPYPLSFTLEGVQGQALHRVFSNDHTATTMTLMPGVMYTTERKIYSATNVDTKSLYQFGNVDLNEEIAKLTKVKNSNSLLAPDDCLIGKIINKNQAKIKADGHAISYDKAKKRWEVPKPVVSDILQNFHKNVLQGLKTTDFKAMVGTLARADRVTSASPADFGDATGAPGLGSQAAIDAAHAATHQVIVNLRLHLIDPAKLSK